MRVLPVGAVGGGQNHIVGDQRAAAEARAVQEETNLVRKLARCGDASADDPSHGRLWGIFQLKLQL